MLSILRRWGTRYLSDAEAVVLLGLMVGVVVITQMADVFLPILASVILAFLLHTLSRGIAGVGISSRISDYLVFIAFMGISLWLLMDVLPTLIKELSRLFHELPVMLQGLQKLIASLPERYPHIITAEQISAIEMGITDHPEVRNFGRTALAASLTRIPGMFEILIYFILVPMMAFLWLFDIVRIKAWFARFFPQNKSRLMALYAQTYDQLGNYIKGKTIEAVIVSVATYMGFVYFHLNFALLLSVFVGLSVFIPVVGFIVVTGPVVMVALVQFGLTAEMGTLLFVYAVIQFLDGYVLTPLLFSGMVSLHPLAILIAILVFGGLWGMWGVFFAIPLAIVLKNLIEGWPVKVD